ncbi:uncharacterized protein LOC101781490 [Setaria italica]|uniref:uncharacterized protein LOC101781490 n=1 Tax=Setaria italica TaxID=4555 RepID=UPI000BE50A47|nr:uncharacterized protein LOC101781490 [Setaria italica]
MATHPASPTAGAGDDRSPSGPPPVHLSAAQAMAAIQPTSPWFFFSSLAAASAAASSPHRRIGITVDLSDESAFAVKWAVQNYLRPRDAVVLLHVRPTSVLYGADWGSIPVSVDDEPDAGIAEGAARAAATFGEEETELIRSGAGHQMRMAHSIRQRQRWRGRSGRGAQRAHLG